jgi:hypothetical protein
MTYRIACALHDNKTIANLHVGETHNCDVSTRHLGPIHDEVVVSKLAEVEFKQQQLKQADLIAQQRLDECKGEITQARIDTQSARDEADAYRANIEAKLKAADDERIRCEQELIAAKTRFDEANRNFELIAKSAPLAMDACAKANKPVTAAQKRHRDMMAEHGQRHKIRKLSQEALTREHEELLLESKRVFCSFCRNGVFEDNVHVCSWYGVDGNNVLSVCNKSFSTRIEYARHVAAKCTICCSLNDIHQETINDDFDMAFHKA